MWKTPCFFSFYYISFLVQEVFWFEKRQKINVLLFILFHFFWCEKLLARCYFNNIKIRLDFLFFFFICFPIYVTILLYSPFQGLFQMQRRTSLPPYLVFVPTNSQTILVLLRQDIYQDCKQVEHQPHWHDDLLQRSGYPHRCLAGPFGEVWEQGSHAGKAPCPRVVVR